MLGTLAVLRVVQANIDNDANSGFASRRHAAAGVFVCHALGRINTQALRRQQVGVWCRLAVCNIVDRDNRVEQARNTNRVKGVHHRGPGPSRDNRHGQHPVVVASNVDDMLQRFQQVGGLKEELDTLLTKGTMLWPCQVENHSSLMSNP